MPITAFYAVPSMHTIKYLITKIQCTLFSELEEKFEENFAPSMGAIPASFTSLYQQQLNHSKHLYCPRSKVSYSTSSLKSGADGVADCVGRITGLPVFEITCIARSSQSSII